MGKSVSNDLRRRMVCGIAAGKSRRAVAAQSEVAPSTAVRVQARYETTGSVEPAKQGRPKGSGKLGPVQDATIAKVKAQPDITMPDLADWLEADHGVTVDTYNRTCLRCLKYKTPRQVLYNLTQHNTKAGIKTLLRKAKARTYDALWRAVGDICGLFHPQECWNSLKQAGYVAD